MNEFPVLARHSKIFRLNFRKTKQTNKRECQFKTKGRSRVNGVSKGQPTKTKIHLQQPILRVKGQMNQKIDIFFFVALPSLNTKKNHPK